MQNVSVDDFDASVQCEEVYSDEDQGVICNGECGEDCNGTGMCGEEPEPWDGDWDGADGEVLAMAGWGTDEDYGYFGGEEEY